MKKKTLGWLIGIIISIVMLYIVFKKVNISDVLKYIYNANIFYLLVNLILGILLLVLRSYRWKLLIKEYKSYPLIRFIEATSIGLFFNTFLPFRIGDLIQGVALSEKISLPKSLTLSSVFMERFIDMFPPVIFIIIGSFFIVLPKQISLVLSILILLVLVLGMFFLLKFRGYILLFFRRLANKGSSYLKLKNLIEKFFLAIGNFKDKKVLYKIIPLTFLLWSGYAYGMFLICLSLDINLPSVWAGYLIEAITSISVAIPSSPGYVGSWELMGSLAVSIFGVPKAKAVAFALVSHFLGMLPVTILGVMFLLKEMSLLEYLRKEDIQENSNEI